MKQRYLSELRRGVAAVELAFVMPFILILLLGMWEVGRMVEMQQLMSNAVREGARQAATGNFTNAQIQTVVTQYLTVAGIPTTNATVTVSDSTTGGDVSTAVYLDQLSVSVTIPLSDVRWSVLNIITPNPTNMSAKVLWVTMVDKAFSGFPDPPAG